MSPHFTTSMFLLESGVVSIPRGLTTHLVPLSSDSSDSWKTSSFITKVFQVIYLKSSQIRTFIDNSGVIIFYTNLVLYTTKFCRSLSKKKIYSPTVKIIKHRVLTKTLNDTRLVYTTKYLVYQGN